MATTTRTTADNTQGRYMNAVRGDRDVYALRERIDDDTLGYPEVDNDGDDIWRMKCRACESFMRATSFADDQVVKANAYAEEKPHLRLWAKPICKRCVELDLRGRRSSRAWYASEYIESGRRIIMMDFGISRPVNAVACVAQGTYVVVV